MTRRVRVRNVYPFEPADRELLGAVDARYELVHEGEDTQGCVDGWTDPEVEVLWASHVPSDLGRMPALRWFATAGSGVDDLVPHDPWGRGLTVTNASGVHAPPIGEYVLGAALLGSERIRERLANRTVRAWGDVRGRLAAGGLRGRTALVVGYGSIGREVARLLHGCGMRIVAIKSDPGRRPDDGWAEPGTGDPAGVLPERLEGPHALRELAALADLVVLTVPATPATTHLVDAGVLAAMRPGAWVVNVGRGSAIDEAALLAALRAGHIAGAVLDVTGEEPLPADHPLWDEPRCVVTPHVAGLGDPGAVWHRQALLLAEQLRRDAAGLPLLNVTTGARGY